MIQALAKLILMFSVIKKQNALLYFRFIIRSNILKFPSSQLLTSNNYFDEQELKIRFQTIDDFAQPKLSFFV